MGTVKICLICSGNQWYRPETISCLFVVCWLLFVPAHRVMIKLVLETEIPLMWRDCFTDQGHLCHLDSIVYSKVRNLGILRWTFCFCLFFYKCLDLKTIHILKKKKQCRSCCFLMCLLGSDFFYPVHVFDMLFCNIC